MKFLNTVILSFLLIGLVASPLLAAETPSATPILSDPLLTTDADAEEATPTDVQDEVAPDIPENSPDSGTLADEEPVEYGTITFFVTMPDTAPDGVIMVEMENLTGAFHYDYVQAQTGDSYTLPTGTYSFAWYGDGYFTWRGTFDVEPNQDTPVYVTPQVEAYGTIQFDVRMPDGVPDPRVRIAIRSTPGTTGEIYDFIDTDGSTPAIFTLPTGTWYWRTSAMSLSGTTSGSFTLAAGDQQERLLEMSIPSTANEVTVAVTTLPAIDLTNQIACIYPATNGTYWSRRCITLGAAGTGSFGPLNAGSYIVALNERGLYPQLESTKSVSSGGPTTLAIDWTRRAGGTVTFTADYDPGIEQTFVYLETSDGGWAGGNQYLYAGESFSVELPEGDYRYAWHDPFVLTPDYTYFTVEDGSTQTLVVDPDYAAGSVVSLAISDPTGGSPEGYTACVTGWPFSGSRCFLIPADGIVEVGFLPGAWYQLRLYGDGVFYTDQFLDFTVTDAPEETFTFTWQQQPAVVSMPVSSGRSGVSYTVTGSVFQPNQPVTVRWGAIDGPVLASNVMTDSKGAFSTSVVIPAAAQSSVYSIHVSGPGDRSATVSFEVANPVPMVVLQPNTGPAGSTVRVLASGYLPGEIVDIRWGSTILRSGLTTMDGEVNYNVVIPGASVGTYNLTVTGRDSLANASTSFSVSSSVLVLLQPGEGPAGSAVRVLGTGFGSGEMVDIRWGSMVLRSGLTTTDGEVNYLVTIPSASAGDYPISVTGRLTGKTGIATYTVTGTVLVLLQPGEGPAGSTVRVLGTGFGSGEMVDIRWGSMVLRSGLTTTDGEVNYLVTIPSASSGSYPVSVTGRTSGKTGDATYTVTGAVMVLLQPGQGPAGSTVRVLGTGFGPGEMVDIRWGSTILRSGLTTTDGEVNYLVTIPSASAGSYPVSVTGRTSGKTGDATYTVTGAVMVILQPGQGQAGSTVRVLGTGFGPGETVDIRWGSTILRSGLTTTDGEVNYMVTIPSASPGTYMISVTGRTSGKTGSVNFTLTIAGSVGRDFRSQHAA